MQPADLMIFGIQYENMVNSLQHNINAMKAELTRKTSSLMDLEVILLAQTPLRIDACYTHALTHHTQS